MLTENRIESDVVVSDTLARLGVSSKVAGGNLPRGLPLVWGRVGLSRSGWLHTCSGVCHYVSMCSHDYVRTLTTTFCPETVRMMQHGL